MYLEDQTVPMQGESTEPAQQSKGALEKKQLISRLKMMLITHGTLIIIHHKIISMKHIPGVEAIMNEQPKEHLLSLLTTTIPHPFKCRYSTKIPHQRLINMINFNRSTT
jgi:hypothetical protein